MTSEQETALRRVFDRQLICAPNNRRVQCDHETPLTYEQFKATAYESFDCVMVQWCGMWLGIEKDGYTHS
jgi:hypothetical protein